MTPVNAPFLSTNKLSAAALDPLAALPIYSQWDEGRPGALRGFRPGSASADTFGWQATSWFARLTYRCIS
jgi:hypothetical protein